MVRRNGSLAANAEYENVSTKAGCAARLAIAVGSSLIVLTDPSAAKRVGEPGRLEQIKRRRPDIITVLGGANVEGEQGAELMANYPELDFVGRGECDTSLVDLTRDLAAGNKGHGILGFLARGDDNPQKPTPPLHGPELDASPHPRKWRASQPA